MIRRSAIYPLVAALGLAASAAAQAPLTLTEAIADLLCVSPATVETHRAHILQKLDVHNAAELVLYAVRRGVIS